MTTSPSSAVSPRSAGPPRRALDVAYLLISLATLGACTDAGILEPNRSPMAGAGSHAAVVVTPNYSAFDTRAEFNGAGVIDHLNGFSDLTGDVMYILPTPWTTNGVTYTSALNIVFGPGIGMGVTSNVLSTEFATPLTGQFADTDAFKLFGADLSLIGPKVPVSVVISTNVASYAFANLDVPVAGTGLRFFGIALSNPGEHLTGFSFTVGGSGSALLIDDVAVGHVGPAQNAEPEVSVGGPYTGSEGASITLAMSGSDADEDALTYSWNLGDGTTGSGPTPPSGHVYGDNGSYEIMLAVEDGRGGVDTARTTATVSNVAPSLAAFSVSSAPRALGSAGVEVPVAATFSDPGFLDTHTATLDCGAGVTTESNAPNGQASGTCTFSSAGVYSVRLTVRDDDGGSDTKVATGEVVVFDAAGGWVTGGGWVASPMGAYTAAPSVAGKLSFELAARYKSSTDATPSGDTKFSLNVDKLEFVSTTLNWLVVGGGTATWEGQGTLNGAGDYAFAVVAKDGGSVDGIRIRIWHRTTGDIVYDNHAGEPVDSVATTPLGGGSIQIRQTDTGIQTKK